MFSKLSKKLLLLTITLILQLTSILSHPKGDTFRKLTAASPTGVVNLNGKSFNDLVMKHPRPYDVVILFTLKFKCNICEQVQEIFDLVSESVSFVEAFKPDVTNKKRAVFFVKLYYSDETSSIFKKLKLPSTTTVMYTTPHNIIVDEKNEPSIKYDEDFVIAYRDRGESPMPHKIMEFVNAKSGRKMELKKNPLHFIMYFIIFVSFLFICFWLYNTFTSFFLNPWLWHVASLLIFIICIGGIVYNINNGAPLAKFDRNGQMIELIHKGQRSQYVLEGLLMSSLFVVLGSLLVALSCLNKIRSYWVHRISSILILLFVVLISRIIIVVYQKKASWYGPTFVPPSGYTEGPLIKDQGNAF